MADQAPVAGQDRVDVVDGLAVRRDAVVPGDGARSGIVGRQGFAYLTLIILIFEEEVTEMASAGVNVLTDVIGVRLEGTSRARHQLHQSDGALAGDGFLVVGRFGHHQGMDEFGREAMS